MALINDGPGFEQFTKFDGANALTPLRDVYCCGAGPPVVVMHELYGATPNLFRFAYRVAAAGFSVYVPILFGQPNRSGTGFYAVQQAVAVCLTSEFAVFASNRLSAITDWLRALASAISAAHNGKGVGVVGLCLTGNFALSMMLDPITVAPVVCEPALPFAVSGAARRALHLSDSEIAAITARTEQGLKILAFRFNGDCISPSERYENLCTTFPGAIRGDGYLKPTCPHAHSVFVEHYDDSGSSTRAAFDELREFLRVQITHS